MELLLPLLPLMLLMILVLGLPEVTRKHDVITIGTLLRKKYNVHEHRFDIRTEKHGLSQSSFRKSWFVCISVYRKDACGEEYLTTHYIPTMGMQTSARKKEAKIRGIIQQDQ